MDEILGAAQKVSTPSARIARAASITIRWLLLAALAALCVYATWRLVREHQFAVDIEIPLRAAVRWLQGGKPYLPEAFAASGSDLPFLYPPFVLPVVAPLLALPRDVVHVAWVLVCVVAAVVACERLGVPRIAWPLALIWPPFAEGILGGNVQIILFAAFCVLFWPKRPVRDDRQARSALVAGVLATSIGALKASQFQPWLYVLRERPRAALLGAAAADVIVVATLPFVGTHNWQDWVGQVGRAGDTSWLYVGSPLSLMVGRPIGLLITVLSAVLAFVVPRRHAGEWVGILTIIGAPSLHIFGMLFLLPAMLLVRREIGLVAALLIATYYNDAIWIAIALVTGAMLAARVWPRLLDNPSAAPGNRGAQAPSAAATA